MRTSIRIVQKQAWWSKPVYAEAEVSFEIGELAGDYRVLERIGQGGMGAVYKVRHAISDRVEAMKILLPDLREGAGLEDRFLREIQVQASLSHPNIAALHTAFRFRNQLLMVMEYIEGDSLRTVMTTRGTTIAESVRYIREVLAALSYAHGRGVVHRDIKPGNIMIVANGRVKLLDFGLASASRASQLTRSGAVMGSMPYASPEQVQSMRVDARSDLYSVGVTFYQLVTGALPIPGESDFALMEGHVKHIPIEPAARNPNVPSAISAAIMRSLEKDPALRFQTADDFLGALDGEETMTLPIAIATSAAIGGIDAALIERATRELTRYIGPIARVIVKREMKRTGDWNQLRQRLAEEIPILRDREKFLTSVH